MGLEDTSSFITNEREQSTEGCSIKAPVSGPFLGRLEDTRDTEENGNGTPRLAQEEDDLERIGHATHDTGWITSCVCTS